MKYEKISPVRGLQGEIHVPGDKSITHRAIMLGSMAGGTTVIENFLASDDCRRTADAFRKLGVSIVQRDDTLFINGEGFYGLKEASDVIDVGNSGTSMRLLTGILAGAPFLSVLTGDSSLRKRPMKRVIEPILKMNGHIYGRRYKNNIKHNDVFAPLAIDGKKLSGTKVDLPVASAQLKSAVILAGLFAHGWTHVTEPSLSRNHTEIMLPAFSGDIFVEGNLCRIQGGQALFGTHIKVYGDFSSAAFFIVGALITKDSELLIKDVCVNPTRTGLLDVLCKMGANIEVRNVRTFAGEKVADIWVKSSDLKGTEVSGNVVPRMIDEFPIFCVAAARAQGKTTISGAKELRVKESDRISSVCKNLLHAGVTVEETKDGMIIEGGENFSSGEFESYKDHRMAMSMAIAGLAGKGESKIIDTECVETSFPNFWELLGKVVL